MNESQALITSTNRMTNSYATQWNLTTVSETMFKVVRMGSDLDRGQSQLSVFSWAVGLLFWASALMVL